MAREAGERYASMGELATALTGFLRTATATGPPESPAGPARASDEMPRRTDTNALVGQLLGQAPEAEVPLALALSLDPEPSAPERRRQARRWPMGFGLAAPAVLGLLLFGVVRMVAPEKRAATIVASVPKRVARDRGLRPHSADPGQPPPKRSTPPIGKKPAVPAPEIVVAPSPAPLADPSPGPPADQRVQTPAADRKPAEATIDRGQWSIEGQELVLKSVMPDAFCVFGDGSWSNYDLRFQARCDGGREGFWVRFHQTERENYCLMGYGSYYNKLFKIECLLAGRFERIAQRWERPGAVEHGRWYDARIEVRGEAVRCYLDGQEVMSRVDSRFSRGQVGLGAWNTAVRFRDIIITDPEGDVLYQGLPALPGQVAAAPLARQPVPPGTEVASRPATSHPLFNGANLDGWKCITDALPKWEVTEGAIHAGSNGRLFTDRDDLGDFHLRAEVRAGPNAFGNLFFRSTVIQGRPSAYAVRITTVPPARPVTTVGDEGTRARTGSLLVSTRDPHSIQTMAHVDTDLIRANHWFTLELLALGYLFELRLNGKTIARAYDVDGVHRRGHIELHRGSAGGATGAIEFRKIEVVELERGSGGLPATGAPRPEWLLTAAFPVAGQAATWSYTTMAPGPLWMNAGFDDRSWKRGQAPFANPGDWARTPWTSRDIWLRARALVPELKRRDQLFLYLRHDEDVAIFVNGKPLYAVKGFTPSYVAVPLSAAQKALFRRGANTIAVYCHNGVGGQGIDVGLRLLAAPVSGHDGP
jgi:hypothetical protein